MSNGTLNVCPRCGESFSGYPALSRKDNKTHICPKCGNLEAVEIMKKAMGRK